MPIIESSLLMIYNQNRPVEVRQSCLVHVCRQSEPCTQLSRIIIFNPWNIGPGRWPQAWWKVMAAYPDGRGMTVSPVWLPVHRDQLRAQRSVTSMRELYLLLIPSPENQIHKRIIGGRPTLKSVAARKPHAEFCTNPSIGEWVLDKLVIIIKRS